MNSRQALPVGQECQKRTSPGLFRTIRSFRNTCAKASGIAARKPRPARRGGCNDEAPDRVYGEVG